MENSPLEAAAAQSLSERGVMDVLFLTSYLSDIPVGLFHRVSASLREKMEDKSHQVVDYNLDNVFCP
jgi:hypothetical protein